MKRPALLQRGRAVGRVPLEDREQAVGPVDAVGHHVPLAPAELSEALGLGEAGGEPALFVVADPDHQQTGAEPAGPHGVDRLGVDPLGRAGVVERAHLARPTGQQDLGVRVPEIAADDRGVLLDNAGADQLAAAPPGDVDGLGAGRHQDVVDGRPVLVADRHQHREHAGQPVEQDLRVGDPARPVRVRAQPLGDPVGQVVDDRGDGRAPVGREALFLVPEHADNGDRPFVAADRDHRPGRPDHVGIADQHVAAPGGVEVGQPQRFGPAGRVDGSGGQLGGDPAPRGDHRGRQAGRTDQLQGVVRLDRVDRHRARPDGGQAGGERGGEVGQGHVVVGFGGGVDAPARRVPSRPVLRHVPTIPYGRSG